MRRQLTIAGACALVASVAVSHPVSADWDAGSTQTISVSVSLPGFATPAALSGGGDPCAGRDPYTRFHRVRDGRFVREGEAQFFHLNVSPVPPGSIYSRLPPLDGGWATVPPVVTPTHEWWIAACVEPESGAAEPGAINGAWVPLVTQDTVVPALSQYLEDYLLPPAIRWPSVDREFGWLYVKAPMDFRVVAPAAISLTATVTNITGTATATVSARPTAVVFEAGEPGGGSVTCSIAEATAAYSPDEPGACSYTWQNSSAVGHDGEFGWRATLVWEVTTSSPAFPSRVLQTSSYGSVTVAEAQAVVTG